MDFDTFDEGLRLVERAAGILAQAAATVEMTLELMSESEESSIH